MRRLVQSLALGALLYCAFLWGALPGGLLPLEDYRGPVAGQMITPTVMPQPTAMPTFTPIPSMGTAMPAVTPMPTVTVMPTPDDFTGSLSISEAIGGWFGTNQVVSCEPGNASSYCDFRGSWLRYWFSSTVATPTNVPPGVLFYNITAALPGAPDCNNPADAPYLMDYNHALGVVDLGSKEAQAQILVCQPHGFTMTLWAEYSLESTGVAKHLDFQVLGGGENYALPTYDPDCSVIATAGLYTHTFPAPVIGEYEEIYITSKATNNGAWGCPEYDPTTTEAGLALYVEGYEFGDVISTTDAFLIESSCLTYTALIVDQDLLSTAPYTGDYLEFVPYDSLPMPSASWVTSTTLVTSTRVHSYYWASSAFSLSFLPNYEPFDFPARWACVDEDFKPVEDDAGLIERTIDDWIGHEDGPRACVPIPLSWATPIVTAIDGILNFVLGDGVDLTAFVPDSLQDVSLCFFTRRVWLKQDLAVFNIPFAGFYILVVGILVYRVLK